MRESIERAKKLLESAGYKVIKESKEYSGYTPSQLENELSKISDQIDHIVSELEDTYYDDRDEYLDQLDNLSYDLSVMEDYLTDEQYQEKEELLDKINQAENTEYKGGNARHSDHYAERGLRQSDFQ